MMIVKEITSLAEFEPWSGAKDNYCKIIENNLDEEFIEFLDEFETELTETELNDILWFEDELIKEFFEMQGIESEVE